MKKVKWMPTLIIFVVVVGMILVYSMFSHKQTVNVILDTDNGTDVDDAGAIAVLNAMADKGEVNIVAMMNTTSYNPNVAAMDAINTYYGHGNIPIGQYKGTFFLHYSWKDWTNKVSSSFPHDLMGGSDTQDATTLYRQKLNAASDHSITIITVGPLRNIQRLMQSASGDDGIAKTGIQLITEKVKKIVIGGGHYPFGGKWNFDKDEDAANYVLSNWPSKIPITLVGGEVGDTIYVGSGLTSSTPTSNPVRKAFEIIVGAGKTRNAWDQAVVLEAVRGDSIYYKRVTIGSVGTVNPGGYTTWRSSPDKNQAYVVKLMSDSDFAADIDSLMNYVPKIYLIIQLGINLEVYHKKQFHYVMKLSQTIIAFVTI